MCGGARSAVCSRVNAYSEKQNLGQVRSGQWRQKRPEALRETSHVEVIGDSPVQVKVTDAGHTVESPTHSEAETISTTPAAGRRLCEDGPPGSLAVELTPTRDCPSCAPREDSIADSPETLVSWRSEPALQKPKPALHAQQTQPPQPPATTDAHAGHPLVGHIAGGRSSASLDDTLIMITTQCASATSSKGAQRPRLPAAVCALTGYPVAGHAAGRRPEKAPWPEVPVTMATRVILLQWARWGRNSWRIRQEEKIKAMQHTRHPRQPMTPLVSPQPSPRKSSEEAGPEGKSAQAARSSRIDTSRCSSARCANPPTALWVDEMIQDQRDCMDEQGLRMKLSGKLDPQVRPSGTPGFGVDTPDFTAARSRMTASSIASVVSSGIASPLADGQLSPWILEAEALVNEGDTGAFSDIPPGAWEVSNSLSEIPEVSALVLDLPGSIRVQDEDAGPIDDEDELDKVSVLVNTGPGPAGRRNILEEPRGNMPIGNELEDLTASLNKKRRQFHRRQRGYTVGQNVRYWSASHGFWMPARIVERKSRSVFLVDKQMSGCLSKVRVSDLQPAVDDCSGQVTRAFAVLEKGARHASQNPPEAEHCHGQTVQVSVQARAVKPRGRIVRDDFSDDSD